METYQPKQGALSPNSKSHLTIVFVVICIIAAILFVAFRIILGWIVSAPALAKFDRGAMATFGFIFKLGILMLAGIIIWAFWASSRG